MRSVGVLGNPEFRALWLAEAQSLLGDQLARVALVVLAYRETGSPAVTGLIYALTFLPAIFGGVTLSGLADRLPRRSLMIGCDLARAVLVASMAIPHVPLAVLCCLLVVAVVAGRPFAASQLALLPEVLPGDSLVAGTGLRMVTDQLGQLIGFAAGGLLVAALGPDAALVLDAATFVLSAVIIRIGVRHRPAAGHVHGGSPATRGVAADMRAAFRLVFGDARLRALLGLGCLAAFHVVPEGLAPAYADSVGGGAASVGLLMAMLPLGTAVGAWLLLRLRPERRSRLVGPLAVATAVPLIACGMGPAVPVSLALWAASGLCAAYQVQASAGFVAAVPDAGRGAAVGLASSAIIAAQGMGLVGFGAAADYLNAPAAIAIAGAAAFVLALPLALSWGRASAERTSSEAPPLAA
jgi:Major Facilitator Superfamily